MEPLQAGDPQQVGSYRLVARLGAGGMGQVYLGDSPGGRKVAVKILLAQLAADGDFRRRFAREVAAARQVGGFHTAPVVDADPGADPPWMATAYIPGPSLATAVQENGPLDPAAVRQLGAALAEGLAAIHSCGLVHRDLKPGNIILAQDGPRIIDFGIARSADTTAVTSSGVLIGTFWYMSPEQVNGQPVDARSDMFSLGSVLAYAATGRAPFEAATIPAIAQRIASGSPDLEGIEDQLRDVILACMAKDPGQGPGNSSFVTADDNRRRS
jgi:serine/threonine protein kinase